eukprot:gnl/Hemi2/12104_TR4131_c0_g1_i1.p1 gnl/Hemi2/12104_TR4131_c0_g1~~gnl/Hemi2/12104_TR4131_c0_g1_i1.p1  ORF type:complete len:415 (-),score=103.50 gnl/Hemi2/12104_TR4131_c0_g1_i1:97-1182(-)
MRSAICNEWATRDFEPCVALMESWQPVIPRPIFETLIDQLIFPRLQREVDSWNPRADTVPIHVWIHPWLPLLGARIAELCTPIRHKLAVVLQDWLPSDPSALIILSPWRDVFDSGTWDALLLRTILPKLAISLNQFVINPRQQFMDPFHWVLAWHKLLPDHAIIALFEKEFFPKFFQVLYTWLNAPQANYEEITRWYLGWKALFPPDLLANEVMRVQFVRALEIMNQKVSGAAQSGQYVQPGVKENISYLRVVEQRDNPVQRAQASVTNIQSASRAPTRASDDIDFTFKEVVEKYAEENEIIFLPKPGALQEGKQVYAFGSRSIYLDKRMVYLMNQGMWKPVSLTELVKLVKADTAKRRTV